MIHTKELEAVMNLIYEDFCKTLVTIGHTSEVMEIKKHFGPKQQSSELL